jgi:hypothetical protein
MKTQRRSAVLACTLTSIALLCAGTALAVDRSADTAHARQSADTLKGDLEDALRGRDAHYVRTWLDYCAKDQTRGGCDTVLRRLKPASPEPKTHAELQRDPAVDVGESKAR